MQTLDVMAKNLKREENVRSDFLRWIGAISERIYQEMHYQFECNKPKTLVFFPTPMVSEKSEVERRKKIVSKWYLIDS
jgi:hypothetical protein